MPAVSHRREEHSSLTQETREANNVLLTSIQPFEHHHQFPLPKIRLHLEDLSHASAGRFLSCTDSSIDIFTQAQNVLNLLYSADDVRPGTRSISVILRSFAGVAYTSGIDLDQDHKEICLSSDYVCSIQDSNLRDEILGVICHELVHCFQWNAEGTCPGGLIEGIADWVRLRAGLGAAHWKREHTEKWDRGYEHTAYFLDYLERRYGPGTVQSINRALRCGAYDENALFTNCCQGLTVQTLWQQYGEDLARLDTGQSTPSNCLDELV